MKNDNFYITCFLTCKEIIIIIIIIVMIMLMIIIIIIIIIVIIIILPVILIGVTWTQVYHSTLFNAVLVKFSHHSVTSIEE